MATVSSYPLATSAQVQGNILAPFGTGQQAFLFLSFGNQQTAARDWLAAAVTRVSSTADVRAAKEGAVPRPASWMNIGLTATGIVTLHREAAADLIGFRAFWNGPLGSRLDEDGRLTTTAALVGDVDGADPTHWVIGGPEGPPVDALLTIAADGDDLAERLRAEREAAEDAGLIVLPGGVQRGEVLLHKTGGYPIEHFGFADGISQPGIRGFTPEVAKDNRLEHARRPGSPIIAPGEFLLGHPGERRPPSAGARPEPAGWMADGSFQVFRRLRQDVAGWWEKMGGLSGWGSSPEDVGARALGRRLDGTPLAPKAKPGNNNDFGYADDQDGRHTPLYAHIRKMNPRDDLEFRDRSHKLLRRGIPYGPAYEPDRTPADRGVLFNAYMASIEDQFEFLQRRWANNPNGPVAASAPASASKDQVHGLDPIVGDGPDAARRRLGKKAAGAIPPLAMGGFVTTTGAVYAFAPSTAALRQLAGRDPLPRG
jgi:Dyp-type peroxidase family